MLTTATIVLTITAIGGLILAANVLSGKLANWAISIIHALLGAAGLIMLGMTILEGNSTGKLTAAFALLVIAALGGFFLASFHTRKAIAPKAIVIIHAGVAVAGFLTLLSIVVGF